MPDAGALSTASQTRAVVLQGRDLRVRANAPELNIDLEHGEIVGIAGLDGHGQEEFLEVLCSLRKPVTGEVRVHTGPGTPWVSERIRSFHRAARAGVAYLPRDRKSEGILPSLSVLDNFSMVILRKAARAGFLRQRYLRNRYSTFRQRVAIIAPKPSTPITSLSGGNQQKVLLARLGNFVSPGATTGSIPLAPIVLLWLGVGIAIILVLRYSTFGRQLYAVGSNPVAARLALVRPTAIWVSAFALSGACAGLAGLLLLRFSGSAFAGVGDPYLFLSVGAVVIGGTSLVGGRGGYAGTMAGAIILTELTTILVGFNFSGAQEQVFLGLIIVLVVLVYGREAHVRMRI